MSKLETKLNKKVKILLTRPEKDSLNFSKLHPKDFGISLEFKLGFNFDSSAEK